MLTEQELEEMVTQMIDGKDETMVDLYCEYCKELDQYDTKTYPEGEDAKVYKQYTEMEGCVIREINKDGKHVGFLITMVRPYDKGTLFICEAYVKPGHRKRGYMKEAIKDALHGGKYGMVRFLVFEKNNAVMYWNKVLQEAGYKRMATDKVSDCLQEYYYAKVV